MSIKLTKSWWFAVLSEMTNKIKNRVQKKRRNADNKKFNAYERSYAELKSKGKTRRKGESQQSYSARPDMTLTGITMDSIQVSNVSNTGGYIGSLTNGNTIRHLENHKNYSILGTNPKAPEYQFFKDQFSKKMGKELKLMAKKNSKTIVIKA